MSTPATVLSVVFPTGPRPSRLGRTQLAVAALACLGALAAGCGGGPAASGVASLGKGTPSTTASAGTSGAPAGSGGPGGQAISGAGAPSGQAVLSSGAGRAQALAYARCMRTHGLPAFPDPGANGTFSLSVDPGSSQFQAADKSCRHLLPNGGQLTPAQLARAMAKGLAFSRCMRAHGLPDFPDPGNTGNGIGIRITTKKGQVSDLDPNSPRFQAAQKACQGLVPGPKSGTFTGGPK